MPKFVTRNDKKLRFTFSVGDTTQAQLVLSKTNTIGDTEYNI